MIILFLLFIITIAFSTTHLATSTSHKKDCSFYYEGLMRIDSLAYDESAHKINLFLSPGIYRVETKGESGWLSVPVYVDQLPQQDFHLFGSEDLSIDLSVSNNEYGLLRKISLSGVRFLKIDMSLVGKRTILLETDTLSQAEASFRIVNPIFNTSVENYILSVWEENNRYEKYMILKQGILSFLKGVEAIALEEDKKISLFESEWVAQNRQTSGIVYRDGVQEIKSSLIKTVPANSDLYIGKEFLGHTPYELFLKEDVPVFITIKHEGYFDQEIKLIRAEMEPEQIIQLTQIEDGGVQF